MPTSVRRLELARNYDEMTRNCGLDRKLTPTILRSVMKRKALVMKKRSFF